MVRRKVSYTVLKTRLRNTHSLTSQTAFIDSDSYLHHPAAEPFTQRQTRGFADNGI